MSLWDKVKLGAFAAGDATKLAAHKTKLRTDMLMLDRDIQNRKRTFGVSMYDHVSPLSQSTDFYAANDDLTTMLRPPLIVAQKEIQALAAKRVKLKETLAQKEANRAASFPTPAETMGQKMLNFGKASAMHSVEAKVKAELAMVDRRIKGFKQQFGLDLYDEMEKAEDERGFLPSDRTVRNFYDQCRGDIQKLNYQKKLKEDELISLGGGKPEGTPPPIITTPNNNNAIGNGGGSSYGGSSYGGSSSYSDNTYSAPAASAATPSPVAYAVPIEPSEGYFSNSMGAPMGSQTNATTNNDDADDLLL